MQNRCFAKNHFLKTLKYTVKTLRRKILISEFDLINVEPILQYKIYSLNHLKFREIKKKSTAGAVDGNFLVEIYLYPK